MRSWKRQNIGEEEKEKNAKIFTCCYSQGASPDALFLTSFSLYVPSLSYSIVVHLTYSKVSIMASTSAISGPIPPPRSLPVTEPQPAPDTLALKYRGATVEDLQLSPAVCVPTTATLDTALQVAFDHDYEQLPVLSSSNGNRKLLGYLDVKKLRADVEAGKLDKSKGVLEAMVKFGGGKSEKGTYTLISPETGLGELESERNSQKRQ
jgi:CBS domain-containing protein